MCQGGTNNLTINSKTLPCSRIHEHFALSLEHLCCRFLLAAHTANICADVDKDDGKMANFEPWPTALYSLGLQKEKPNASHFHVSLFQATVPTTAILCHVYTCWSFSLCWLVTRFIFVSCLHNALLRRWRGALHYCEGQAFSFYGTHSRRSSPDLSCCGSVGRGLVAVRSGCTCHLASSWPNKTLCLCRTAPSARNLAGLVTLT